MHMVLSVWLPISCVCYNHWTWLKKNSWVAQSDCPAANNALPLSVLAKETTSRPCTNRPVTCPACLKTALSYAMPSHWDQEHGSRPPSSMCVDCSTDDEVQKLKDLHRCVAKSKSAMAPPPPPMLSPSHATSGGGGRGGGFGFGSSTGPNSSSSSSSRSSSSSSPWLLLNRKR